MLRRLLLIAFLIGLAAPGVTAQDDQVNTRIYVALYKISYADIPEWIEIYYEHSVPVLEALVEEGAITGFNIRMHQTGGEYNLRQGIFGNADTDFDAFWGAYLGRMAAADAVAFERSSRMIQAHTDEVWNLDVINVPDGAGTGYVYDAQFQVNFADMDRWNRMWAETLLPVGDQAIADGLIQGYAVEGHNTGGRYNWKILWFFDEWDNFDELEAAIFEAAPLGHPIWGLFSAHRDEIWVTVPPTT